MIDMAALQRDWDRMLLTDFYENKSKSVGQLSCQFIELHKINFDVFNLLLRVPRLPRHSKLHTPRFVSAHIPNVAKMAWKLDKTCVDRLVDALAKTKKVDTRLAPDDAYKVTADRVERDSTRHQYRKHVHESLLSQDWYESQNRSNQWNKVK